jgi:quinoprotein glucose dehydrogenase
LTFIGATDDRRLRAFDTKTGAQLWEFKLPATEYGTPMTYAGKNGKQFVVAVSTGGFASTPVESDAVTAFALP